MTIPQIPADDLTAKAETVSSTYDLLLSFRLKPFTWFVTR